MKLLPIPLSPLGAPPPLGMWSSDLLWRYPPAPPSPLAELKTQLPPQLATDPRLWNRDDVVVFLRWCEREFDLPKFDLDLFQMNGKAICLLSKTDFAERCPGAGDVLHNVLHMLIRDTQAMHRHLPSSPVTPTSRYPLSPHNHPPTPNWSALAPPDSPFYTQHFQHFMASNSVTLSPAPSTDSQAGSPPQSHTDQVQNAYSQSSSTSSNGTASNNSDSDEDQREYADKGSPPSQNTPTVSVTTPATQTKHLPPPLVLEPKMLNAWSIQDQQNSTPTPSPSTPSGGLNSIKREFFPNPPTPSTPSSMFQIKREFFPETQEPNTNGRLLWDFLQQLLNDPQQRYSNYIAWKCRDTGVFKIVDPAGLAKLWGIQKNHLSMNYDKMSRALRYYYRVNILRKVQGERHCYQFLRNPTELKSIKNISLLRQTMANQAAAQQQASQQQQQASQQQQQQQQQPTQSPRSFKQESQQQVPPQSPSYLSNGSIASIMSSVGSHYPHLTAIAMPQVSRASPVSPTTPTHALHMAPTTMSVRPDEIVKVETTTDHETDDMKPTDLSTNSERKYMDTSNDCYPLIRNSNGLTTIQILRHENNNGFGQSNGSNSASPSPTHDEPEHMDDLPTDLSKSEASVSYYNSN